LKDIYGSSHKTEISLIVAAAKGGVIDLLDKKTIEKPFRSTLHDIVTKFVSNNTLDKESAIWATVVWAISFQKMTDEDCQQIISNCEPLIFEKNKVLSVTPTLHDPVSCLNSLDSYSINHMHEYGKKLHNQGNYSEAIVCYDRALQINSQDHNILSDKGLSLHNQGNYSEAIVCYDRALQINSHDEFIKRRRNNTMTLLYNQTNKKHSHQNKSQRYFSPYSKSLLSKTYIIAIIVTISGLSLGIAVFAMIGSIYEMNSKSSITDYDVIHNSSIARTEILGQGITSNSKFDQDSITEFTESIEKQIIKKDPNTREFSKNNAYNHAPNGHQEANVKEIEENKPGEIDQKVNNFKLELERAMESNFN
jgi:tetratricopeptide (TPR) repeat protein